MLIIRKHRLLLVIARMFNQKQSWKPYVHMADQLSKYMTYKNEKGACVVGFLDLLIFSFIVCFDICVDVWNLHMFVTIQNIILKIFNENFGPFFEFCKWSYAWTCCVFKGRCCLFLYYFCLLILTDCFFFFLPSSPYKCKPSLHYIFPNPELFNVFGF